ncbi:MAG: Rieske 2Fe-2S domain-containing protein [Phormidesmis sp.]
MSSVLPGASWLIAHRSMLGINKPYQVRLNNQDYVLWQSADGQISALENVCPHMQAPLSNGWICESNNAITCPFHAQKFDEKGFFIEDGKSSNRTLVKPLELIVQNDLIWTYGNSTAQIEIPNLIAERTQGFDFLGVSGEVSIKTDFLAAVKINYDYNHQNGTHRESFQIRDNPVHSFEADEYYARVRQTFIRSENSLSDVMENPALLAFPREIDNELEYTFPSTTLVKTTMGAGDFAQFFILYPESEHITRTFVLSYANWKSPLFKLPVIGKVLGDTFVKLTNKIVEQDLSTLESLYPRKNPKVRLPKEEIMFHAEKLYVEWPKAATEKEL